MAYDLYDFFAGAMGRPDPRQQLASALGQGPGQAGSPQGPQPLAGQNGPPGGPAGPGGSPAPSGGPPAPQQQQQQQAPPTPQAYTSPPDLAQAYLALSQRDQAKQDFWGGLAGVAQALHPGRVTPGMVKSITGQGEDAGSLFNNFVQLQQIQQQNQALQAYRQGIPAMVKALGLPDAFIPAAMADPTLVSKMIEVQAGVGGTQIDKEYKQQVKQFQDANPPGTPLPPELQSEGAWDQAQREAITTRTTAAKTKTEDLIADQRNFEPVLQNYDKTLSTIDQLMTPEMQEAAKEFLGRGGQLKIDTGALSDPAKKAYQLYKNLMATQYTAGTQDFKGSGRITNQMLTQDAPSQSTMGINQAPKDFFEAVGQYRTQMAQHRAHLFGPAQKANNSRLSDEDYARYVLPNQDRYGGPKRNIPDFSKMTDADADAAYDKLSPGQVYIGPDGQPRRK